MKIRVIDSIRTKLVLAMAAMSVLAGLVTSMLLIPTSQDNIDETTRNYMKDVARSYGTMLEAEIAAAGIDYALSIENLSTYLAGVKVDNKKSSYVYVVDNTGTMLYHPTPEKIGKPVENAAVKECLAKMSKGEKVGNDVIQYEFKGVEKYAGVFVNENQDYIVIATADYDDIFATVKEQKSMAIVALLAVVVLVGLVGSFLAYRIIKPVNQAAELTDRVANMDFTSDEVTDNLAYRKDEIGRMAKSLNQLRTALIYVVDDIKAKSVQVMDAATALDTDATETATTMEQVERAVNDIAEGATSQADETQRATEHVVEMGNMVEATNEEVQKLLAFAEEMQSYTKQATNTMSELEKVNQKAEENINIIAEQTNTTNAAALKISEATHLITSIAEETNLLALNASIEAARAGEQGKGFGVVASEIQKLAEQTNQSAVQIEEIVLELLRDSEKAVETMYGVKEIMHAQSDYVEQTERAFDQVATGVDRSIEGINRISEKTSMLDDARTSVVDIVQDLTAIAEENAAGTEQTSASATEVSAIVEDISGKSTAMREVAQALEDGMNIFKM